MLHHFHKFDIIAFIEPFQEVRHVQQYKRRLGMAYSNCNLNGKIRLFVSSGINVEVVVDSDQQLTIKMVFDNGHQMIGTLVYAKCSAIERLELWEDIYFLAYDMHLPWFVGGDFNVIMDTEEKIGGLPVYPSEVEDFAYCNCLFILLKYRILLIVLTLVS